MKKICIPVLLSLSLLSCARTHVTKTYVASGETDPSAIYIRPFSIGQAEFTGDHGAAADLPIRRSLAPMEFAKALKLELEKVAPAVVLKKDQRPPAGWLVEGEFDVVDGGSSVARALTPPTPIGASELVAHVRIIDVARSSASDTDEKEGDTPLRARGNVIYAFDIRGTSGWTGKLGGVHAAGISPVASTFDFKNAAEEIMMVLQTNPKRYGVRESPR